MILSQELFYENKKSTKGSRDMILGQELFYVSDKNCVPNAHVCCRETLLKQV